PVGDVLDEPVGMGELLLRLPTQPGGDAGQVLLISLDGELTVGDRRRVLERDLLLELLLEVVAEFHGTDDRPARAACQPWKGFPDRAWRGGRRSGPPGPRRSGPSSARRSGSPSGRRSWPSRSTLWPP